MDRICLAVGLGLVLLTLPGCLHAREDVHTIVAVHEAPPPPVEPETMIEPPSQPVVEAPPSRPRLSHTVTLGEGTEAQYTPSAPPPQPGQAGGGNVTINNNVIVQQPAPVYGYGGYGYGGYGYGGYGRGVAPRGDGQGGARGPAMWGTNGWEGARRTAAPGQTPNIGGNWPTIPSYGPATMK